MTNVYIEYQKVTPFNSEGKDYYSYCQIVISDYETTITVDRTDTIEAGDMTRDDVIALCNEENIWEFLKEYGCELNDKALDQGFVFLNDQEVYHD